MNDLSRRALIAGMGATAGVVTWPVAASASTVRLGAVAPALGDALRELDVVVESGGQTGAVTLTRYPLYSSGPPEVLGSGAYTAAPGRQTVVIHLEHNADPLMYTYVVSV